MKKALIVSVLLTCMTASSFSQTTFAVRNTAGWVEAVNGIRNGGNGKEYTITVTGTVSVPAIPSNEKTFGLVNSVTITIEGSGTLSPSNIGYLLIIGNEQTIIAKDLTLKGRADNDTSIVGVSRGGTFGMEGKASITGNKGGGVFVSSGGTFTMQDSTSVSRNTGSGVFVDSGGTFTMQDSASVSGNTSSLGSGVDVRGTFSMQGNASVSGNTSSGNPYYGGGVFVNGGTFTMQDSASVSGNTSTSSGGGGVQVRDDSLSKDKGTFTMQDSASVSGNTSTRGGGGVFVDGGTFTMQDSASVSGNTSTEGGGVCVNYRGTFTMKDGTISGNKATESGGGVYVSYDSYYGYRGTFTMEGGTISGNTTATGSGGGVYNSGTFTMKDGTISGNTAPYSGGGVYNNGNFAKNGGTVYGDDAEQKLRNTVTSKLGHAMYNAQNKNWRNAGAGPTMNTDTYGFWLNDGDVVIFPSDFAGEWRRSNFNNTLTITRNIMKSSSRDFLWILQKISGNAYTLKRADTSNTMTLTIRLDGRNLIISGDSGNGENNWNGTWYKQ